MYVPAKGALFERSFTAPVEPEVVWDWLTSAERRAVWQADRVEQVTPGGRTRVGVTNHCIHGPEVTVEEIADWRPFRYYTMSYELPGAGKTLWTYELEAVGGGTRVSVRGEGLTGRRLAAWREIEPSILPFVDEVLERLAGELGGRFA